RPGAWVDIRIDLQGSTCIYTVENSKLDDSPNANGKSGIGLQNVQRRLELSYPGRHELTISDLPDRYSVQLKIALSWRLPVSLLTTRPWRETGSASRPERYPIARLRAHAPAL